MGFSEDPLSINTSLSQAMANHNANIHERSCATILEEGCRDCNFSARVVIRCTFSLLSVECTAQQHSNERIIKLAEQSADLEFHNTALGP